VRAGSNARPNEQKVFPLINQSTRACTTLGYGS
jgi:hypothetical protein